MRKTMTPMQKDRFTPLGWVPIVKPWTKACTLFR